MSFIAGCFIGFLVGVFAGMFIMALLIGGKGGE